MKRKILLLTALAVLAGTLALARNAQKNAVAARRLQTKITQLESAAQKQATDYQKLNRQAQDLQRDITVLQETFQKANIRAKNGDQARQKLEQAVHTFVNGETITAGQLITAKRAFDDIQGEVASGKLRDLALMESYQTLKKILDSPTVESLAALELGKQ